MSRRRFRIGVHRAYDTRFDRCKLASQTLSPMSYQVAWQTFQMSDEHGLTALLSEYKAKLAHAENVVAQADRDFETLKLTRANEGRAIPKERDHIIELEYMDALAECDVVGEEVDKLEGMLAKIVANRQAVEESNVLKYGPCGTGKMGEGNILCVLDGQTIKVNADSILIIDDARSPYNGMTVVDYKKHLVLPWLIMHPRMCSVGRESLPPWPPAVARPDAAD
jgi:hypothetical protein